MKAMFAVLMVCALFLTGCLDPAAQAEAVKRTADGKEKSASSSSQSQAKVQAAEIMLTVEPPEAPERPQQPFPPATQQQPVRVAYPGGQAEVPVGSKVTLKAGSSSSDNNSQSSTISSEQIWKAVRSVPPAVLYIGIGLIVVGFIVVALVPGLRLTGLAISAGGVVGLGVVILLYQFGETIALCVGGGILFIFALGGLLLWYVVRQKMRFQDLALQSQESAAQYQKVVDQTVAGIQKFKAKTDPGVVDTLISCLCKYQDKDVQDLVKGKI